MEVVNLCTYKRKVDLRLSDKENIRKALFNAWDMLIEYHLSIGYTLEEIREAFENGMANHAEKRADNAEESASEKEETTYAYEKKRDAYVNLAYRTLKMNAKAIPTEGRMRVPLCVMFVLHNRDLFGYTTVKEFVSITAQVAEVSENSIRERVIGPYVGGEYAGLKYLLTRYASGEQGRTLSVFWNTNDTEWRYEYLIGIEEKLSKRMEAKAEQENIEFSMLRLDK